MFKQKHLELTLLPFNPKSSFPGLLRRIYPKKTFLYPDPDKDGLNYWRERILFAMAASGAGLAFLALTPAVYQALTKQLWVLLIADILAFLLFCGLLFSRRLGLKAQALTVLSITFAIGVVIIWQVGFMSGGPTWLFSFSVLTGVLLGLRAALGATLLTGAVITLMVWLFYPGKPIEREFLSSFSQSITAGCNFIFLNLVLAVSVAVLVNELQALNRKLSASTSRVFLRPLMDNTLMMVKEKALKQRIELISHIPDQPDSFPGDEFKLKQVLYNLLANALKFTPEGGTIQVRAALENGFPGGDKGLRFSVVDSGIGLDPGDLERIFRPFEQADNSISRRFQGAGLGLALSRKMVELHGGKIWAEREGEGKGSAFHFVVSFREEDSSEDAETGDLRVVRLLLKKTGMKSTDLKTNSEELYDRRGLLYYGLSSFFKMAVKIARRIHIFDFRLEVVGHYDQAVRLAQEILPGSTATPDSVSSRKSFQAAAGDPLKETSRTTVSHDHWQVQTESYSIRYEVINGNIIHGKTTGTLNESEILEHTKLRDEVVSDLKAKAGSFSLVAGFSKSQRVSAKARKI